MKLVLDTDVVVAAMRSPGGASTELLRCIERGQATLLLSVAAALEYEAICQLADHRLASGLNLDEVGVFLDGLVALSEEFSPRFKWRPQLRDPGDEMVLEAAVNGQADMIVTFNLRDFAGAARFGIDCVRPAEALKRIRT